MSAPAIRGKDTVEWREIQKRLDRLTGWVVRWVAHRPTYARATAHYMVRGRGAGCRVSLQAEGPLESWVLPISSEEATQAHVCVKCAQYYQAVIMPERMPAISHQYPQGAKLEKEECLS